MNINIIAAIGKNNELGKDNELIWRFKEDMKFFREVTTGHPIVMGRKTFESLPKLLPNRKHIILSSGNYFPKEVEVYKTIQSFFEQYIRSDEEFFIIGGAQIYKEFIDIANNLYITEIDAECKDADVYFPIINIDKYYRSVLDEHEEGNIKYKHVLYKRYEKGK